MTQAVDFDRTDAFAHVPNAWEVRLHPDSAAAWTVNVTPGSATAGVLAQLDPARLSQAGRVDALVGLERLQAWAAALQTRMIAALVDEPHAGAPAPKLDRQWAKEDVKTALAESVTGAQARIHTATDLVHRLPDTLAALEQGRLTARHASAVVDTVRTLDDTAAREVETAVLPEPERIGDPVPTMAAFRRKLRRAGIAADPRSAAENAARAAEDRDVWVIPQDNGMAYVGAPLPAEGAATVAAAVDAKADQIKTAGDPRTKAQRRADGLVQICADYLNGDAPVGVKIKKDTVRSDDVDGSDPDSEAKIKEDTTDGDGTGQATHPDSGVKIKMDTAGRDDSEPGSGVKIKMDGGVATRSGARAPRYHGLRPQMNVSVALSTLLGMDEQPGELDGHGPIPADLARRLAADPSGTWRRLVTDELGHLIDYGRTTYEPPTDLAQFVIARDRTCRAPGCERPAAKSDLHHVHWWSRGGHTNAANIVSACERIHYGVHDGDWQVTREADGTTVWTSPTGHTYTVPPAAYPVDNTMKIKNDNTEGADAASDEQR
ncbi:MAG TPA: DUF222 domain-containing protein [Jatrophihabitantaceae bacterium]|nr:DUF222 domain-containing protein [Jatrophihabitantaceae bacterium]